MGSIFVDTKYWTGDNKNEDFKGLNQTYNYLKKLSGMDLLLIVGIILVIGVVGFVWYMGKNKKGGGMMGMGKGSSSMKNDTPQSSQPSQPTQPMGGSSENRDSMNMPQ